MGRTESLVELLGRWLIAAIFVNSAVGKVTHPAVTQVHMAAAGMPMVQVFFWAAVAFETLGALSLLVGYWARFGAVLLVLFLLPTTWIFHLARHETGQVLKNLAIMGGLLLLMVRGAGSWSLDAWCDRSS